MKEFELLNIPLIEWIGYVASTLVLISLSLSSILRLRIFNLFGAAVFSFYGFYIGSLPVGIMNLIIVFTNLYYLQKLYFQKDKFEIVESKSNQEYVLKFLNHFKKDIQKYSPDFNLDLNKNQIILMVMRNMNMAGIFVAKDDGDRLEVELDYVTPQYRDYKNGAFIFSHFRKAIKVKEYKTIIANSQNPQQIKYLKKMGFIQDKSARNKKQYFLRL
ncbi:MAG: GNAT family N-acetyltransferase [Draconibacterium sp.]|nr:GNAT family N-acetyltransferase [Draconibacterium sp.]